MADTSSKELLDLLRLERLAIISGAYEQVNNLSKRKSDLLSGLRRSRNSAETLKRIAAAIEHNQVLLAAAIKGIGAARDRLNALSKVKDTLSVYDKSGQMAQVPFAKPGLEKKA